MFVTLRGTPGEWLQSELGLVGPVSVFCDPVRLHVASVCGIMDGVLNNMVDLMKKAVDEMMGEISDEMIQPVWCVR